MGARRGIARTLGLFIGGGVLCAASALSGCSEPLLSATDVRSPFDRYDLVRGNYAPSYIENEYGRKQPNLRARLSPKD